MPNSSLAISSLLGCLNLCHDRARAVPSGLGTRVWNLTDRPVELQIRVGSLLKKVHKLKPGCSKRLKGNNIYKAYMPQGKNYNSKCLMYNYYYNDETCQPYLWVHDTEGDFSRMVKQQYISLDDLRDCCEIKIYRDHQRGCIAVRKKPRTDFC